jgi:hypothetical protein
LGDAGEAIGDAEVLVDAVFDGVVDSGLICPDGGLPAAYLLDTNGALYTFSPGKLEATPLGTPQCGTPLTRDRGPQGSCSVIGSLTGAG